jgi:retron-type reverse transcriptase
VDGISWTEYEEYLETNLANLHKRIHSNTHRVQPSRRQYIPKPDGQPRPLVIVALADKIVQRAMVAVLNAIYEHDFWGFVWIPAWARSA